MLGRALCVTLLLTVANGCKGGEIEPRTGSETNFLVHCTDQCEDDLTCLCGVCTRACTRAEHCSDIAKGAECVPAVPSSDETTGPTPQQGSICELTCRDASGCSSLGEGYRCESGFCRKGEARCPKIPLVPGDEDRTIVVDGVTRKYRRHVPQSYTGETQIPVVLDFHPISLGVEWERANSGFLSLSEEHGFVVIWPYGLNDTWDLGPCCSTSPADDLGFARAILRQLSLEACVDPARIYAVGFSMGGSMAYYLACEHAELVAAIAVSGMDLFTDRLKSCAPSRPVTEVSIRGTEDEVVPYAGGVSSPPFVPNLSTELMGAKGTFEKWAELNACTGAPSAPDAIGCETYSSCAAGTEVTLCSIEGQGQFMGDAAQIWRVLSRFTIP
jgi:polyhydroxybutyrate depolymerase